MKPHFQQLRVTVGIFLACEPAPVSPPTMEFTADTITLESSEPIGFMTDGTMWNGRLVIADGIQGDVKVFEDGVAVMTLGRPGDGPGEFREPFEVSADPATGELVVLDRRRMTVSTFDQAGRFLKGRQLEGFSPGGLNVMENGTRVLFYSAIDSLQRTTSVHFVDTAFSVAREFWERPAVRNPLEGSFNLPHGAALEDRVLVVQGQTNVGTMYSLPSLDSVRIPVFRDVYHAPAWPRTPQGSTDRVEEWMRQQQWITNVEATPIGFLVEMLEYSASGVQLLTYSLVDAAGKEIGRIGPTTFRFIAADEDRLWFGLIGPTTSSLTSIAFN